MRNFKRLLLAGCMSVTLLFTMTGCGKKETDLPTSDAVETESDDLKTDDSENIDADQPNEAGASDSEVEQEMEYLSGTVAEVEKDSFTFHKRNISFQESESGKGAIVDLENVETELITVLCNADTKFEHWTIIGGGEDIDIKDASFSDITKDTIMEIEGYYKEGEFIATRVIIEVDE